MLIACWLQHTGCAKLTAFTLQQWLPELASMFRHTYIACLITDLFLQTEQTMYDCVIASVTRVT
jgi:hypothetical protein